MEGAVFINEDKEKENEGKLDDMTTMEVVRKVANEVNDMIQFTVDAPSNHDDAKMPILDMKVWLNEFQEVDYIFYEKPMKSSFVISESSAFPKSVKMKTLTQEAFRRLHNTKENLQPEYNEIILSDFTQKLRNSGYSKFDRLKIIKGGFKTYNNLKEKEKLGKRPFYRPPDMRNKDRKGSKENKESNWYKKGIANNKFTSVMFIEATPNSELV